VLNLSGFLRCFAAGFVRALKIFAVRYGLLFAFGKGFRKVSPSLIVKPCALLPKIF